MEERNLCLECDDEARYSYNNSCYDICPENTKKSSDGQYKCVSCSEENLLIFEGKCVESCPGDSLLATDGIHCIICKDEIEGKKPYYYEGMCYEKCPENTDILNENTQKCVLCEEKGYHILNKKCVQNCPENYLLNSETNECFTCHEKNNTYLSSLKQSCISSCPETEITTSDYTCESCPENTPYFYNNSCFSYCPKYTIESSKTANLCVECSVENLLKFNESCVAKCPDNYIEKSGVCVYTVTCFNDGKSDGKGGCVCLEDYYGDHCEYKAEEEPTYKSQIYVSTNKKMVDQTNTIFSLKINSEDGINLNFSDSNSFYWDIKGTDSEGRTVTVNEENLLIGRHEKTFKIKKCFYEY